MPGMGSNYAAGGLMGADYQTLSTATTPMTNAAKYDPRTRSIVMLADGSVDVVHPVDQSVAYSLTLLFETISSDPTRGFDWKRLRDALPDARASTAKDLVNLSLADLLKNGDITVDDVQVLADLGRFAICVLYTNIRIHGAASTPLTFAFTG